MLLYCISQDLLGLQIHQLRQIIVDANALISHLRALITA